MPRVKICGITRPEDAVYAVKAGADAIGLQFFDQSIRSISVQQGILIRKKIPPFVATVGVFVNMEKEELLSIIDTVGLDYVQLHGVEDSEYIKDIPARVIKTIRVGGKEDLDNIEDYPVDALLLDAKVDGQLGGTGKSFDWSLLDGFNSNIPIILAGGLCAENIVEAINKTNPQAVDLCSGVESKPRMKSYKKMRDFIGLVRNTQLAG